MASQTEKRTHLPAWATVALLLLALAVLYVLSIGPVTAVVFMMGGTRLTQLSDAFYSPIIHLARGTFLEDPLFLYVVWWWDLLGAHAVIKIPY